MIRKVMALVLAAVMALVVATPAWAANDDGTITVTNATNGQTYEAFLIFKASPSDANDISKGVSYTATAAQVAVTGFGNVFDTYIDADGNYTVSKKSDVTDDAVVAFIKDNIDSLKQGSAISGTYSNNSTIVFSGLEYGYYYITSSLGTVVTIDTAAKSATVVDKNESTPTPPDKLITDEDSAIDEDQDLTDQELESNDASVGSVESFSITFDAVNWVQEDEENTAGTGTGTKTQVLQYNFKDSPTGLTIDGSTVKVFVNVGTDAEQEITSTITGKTVDASTGVLSFTIPWVDANNKSLYETQTDGSALIPVTVTYDATVNATAAVRTAPNKVEVFYNNSFDNDHKLGEDETVTYTWKFKLLKTDENDEPLDGAEFELYYGDTADENAVALTFTFADGVYRFDPNGTVTHIAPTGANAEATIIGLDNASYMLREVVVPTGYNKAADQAVSGLTKETNATSEASTVEPGTTTIKNQKGTELPSTGGMGTRILYTIGGAMIVAGGIYLVAKRRLSAME